MCIAFFINFAIGIWDTEDGLSEAVAVSQSSFWRTVSDCINYIVSVYDALLSLLSSLDGLLLPAI